MMLLLSIVAVAVSIGLAIARNVQDKNNAANSRYRKKSAKPQKNRAPMTAVICLLFFGGFIGIFINAFFSGGSGNHSANAETLFASHGYAVAEKIAPNYKDEKILILFRDNEPETRMEKLRQAVQSKLGGKAEITMVNVNPEASAKLDAEDRPDFQSVVKAKDFDKAIAQDKDAEIIIFACNLPRDAGRMSLWKTINKKHPKVFLLNCPTPMDEAIACGAIAGYTTLDKKAKFDHKLVPGDYSRAFATRYKIVTGNI